MVFRAIWDQMSYAERAQILGYGVYVGAGYIRRAALRKWNSFSPDTRRAITGAYHAWQAQTAMNVVSPEQESISGNNIDIEEMAPTKRKLQFTPRKKGTVTPRKTPKTKSAKKKNKVVVTSRRGRSGAQSSTSSGFFAQGSTKQSKFSKTARKDIVYRFETGSVVASKYCSYVGHATCPTQQILDVIFLALLKQLFKRVQYDITDVAAGIEGLVAGDKIVVEHSTIATPPTFASYTYTASGVNPTPDAIAAFFTGQMVGWSSDFILNKMEFIPAAGSKYQNCVNMSLRNMIVEVDTKSTMKIQNRSKNPLGTEADEVDNVPLYGKFYEGKGNGTNIAIQSGQSIYADNTNGLMYILPVNVTGSLREPPLPSIFPNVKMSGKAHLDPGEIKTSVLTYKTRYNLSKLFTKLADTSFNHDVGKFKFFALEKMLETTYIEADIVAMSIAYEINNQIGVRLKQKYTNTTISGIKALP